MLKATRTIALATTALLANAAIQLPDLPDQFTCTIEANIANKNYTVHMHEWHDVTNDRGRTDMYHHARPTRAAYSDSHIYDYTSGKRTYQMLNKQSNKCTWGSIDHITGRMASQTNGAHLTSSKKFFLQGGNKSNTVYQGQKLARGIWCDHWKYTSNKGNSTMSMDYFFSTPSWDMAEDNGTRVPVRIELTGWRLTTGTYNRSTHKMTPLPKANWTNHTYFHVYSYTSFHVGAPKASVFKMPCGVACTSANTTWSNANMSATTCPTKCSDTPAALTFKTPTAKAAKAANKLPAFPDQFRCTIEANIVNKNYTVHMHEWHDVTNDRGRTDLYHHARGKRPAFSDSSIYDYKTQEIIKVTGGKCTRSSIGQQKGRYLTFSTGPHITSSAGFLLMGGANETNTVYQGVKAARGIKCDHWLYTKTSNVSTMTIDYYFSTPSWDTPEDNSTRVPVRVVLKGTRLSTMNSTYNATSGKYARVALAADKYYNHTYYHVYSYTSFHVGAPAADVFQRPCGMLCTSTNTSWKGNLAAYGCPGACPIAAGATTPAPTPSANGATALAAGSGFALLATAVLALTM